MALTSGARAAHHESSLALPLLAEHEVSVDVFVDSAYFAGATRRALQQALIDRSSNRHR
ncbi:hypothetical protein ACIBCT_22080 [Streptosporangium sp. NPDC050855]|uniref:hypothetical protein n=1 Tax=Streptosporangium sp. NPDC050855 TaxID=3366194 RepID=UPI0037896490